MCRKPNRKSQKLSPLLKTYGTKLHYYLIGGVLFAVNGPDYSNVDIDVQGFTIEIDTGKLRAQWNIPTKVMS